MCDTITTRQIKKDTWPNENPDHPNVVEPSARTSETVPTKESIPTNETSDDDDCIILESPGQQSGIAYPQTMSFACV